MHTYTHIHTHIYNIYNIYIYKKYTYTYFPVLYANDMKSLHTI